jgi:hypothetical protein
MANIFLDERHQYFDLDTGAQLASVTQIIRLLQIRKSFHGVDQAILDFASERGKAVESILYALIQGQQASIDIPQWEQNGTTLSESVQQRVPGIQRWIQEGATYIADQQMVCDLDSGVAGTLDLIADVPSDSGTHRYIIDVKATAKQEIDWSIQLGAYASMYMKEFPSPDLRCAILHINPKFKKGYIFREYGLDDCCNKWNVVCAAWLMSRTAFEEAKNVITKEN